jgi:hypothetical protein
MATSALRCPHPIVENLDGARTSEVPLPGGDGRVEVVASRRPRKLERARATAAKMRVNTAPVEVREDVLELVEKLREAFLELNEIAAEENQRALGGGSTPKARNSEELWFEEEKRAVAAPELLR